MYRIAHGTTHDLPDIALFIELLNRLGQEQQQQQALEAGRLFAEDGELFVARAPGRLDVMGGIADYSGSLVLEMPIREATIVALQRTAHPSLKIVSLTEDWQRELVFEMALSDFAPGGRLIDYESARAYFKRTAEQAWAAYVAGVFLVLMRERSVDFKGGARILITSGVPGGKGVSSSAALEVATMQAVAAAFDLPLEGRETALLCQRAENLVVGAPCGVMDQMTSACGEEGRLLMLLCQPAELQGFVQVPAELSFWGLDSGVAHQVTGADYASVRIGAFMGYRIIAELAGLKAEEVTRGEPVRIDDPKWGGYLSNVSPSEFEQQYAAHLPWRISGAEFLERYRGITDRVTRVEPEAVYAVRVPAAHAVYEHQRVRLFAELLEEPVTRRRLELLGELMYQAHAGYAACGLSVGGTDRLVELVREAGPTEGLYGAKITGGGSGGTVVLLGHGDVRRAVERIAAKYFEETGRQPQIFSGSSPGGALFGHLRLSRDRTASLSSGD
jgi:galactokinase